MNSLSSKDFFSDDNQYFELLRKKEYARLDDQGAIYLDYTGSNLYPQRIIQDHFQMLKNAVLGNPHSHNPSAQLSEQKVRDARAKVLAFFKAKDYYCIFTQNATAGLQIIGESYPFDQDGIFLLTVDNHNSVNGIREYCKHKRSLFEYIRIYGDDLCLDEQHLVQQLNRYSNQKNKLFAFPAQSNVSGNKHDLGWIENAQNLGWDVLLDAAAFVPTSELDLSRYQPNYVTLSFYKMFGYPTGLGCLFIRKDSFEKLQKPWFAGGTVTLVAIHYADHFLAKDHERYENGTVNFLDIPAVEKGLEFMEEIGMKRIERRIHSLTKYTVDRLNQLVHSNKHALIKIYGCQDLDRRGGTILISVLDINGDSYPFEIIESLAIPENISFRTGCFCNPGIDEINNDIGEEELQQYFTSRNQGDYEDMISFIGKGRGAIRISVGIPTTKSDIDLLIEFLSKFKDKSHHEFRENSKVSDSIL